MSNGPAQQIQAARRWLIGGGVLLVLAARPAFAAPAGDPVQGAQAFRSCASCHSIQPGQNMTGPSLAGVVGRNAGTLQSFHRYSDALKNSGIVWNVETLDAWLSNPAALVPGNDMLFPGMSNAVARRNIIAYLAEGEAHPVARQSGMNMGGGGLPNLKDASPGRQVKTIRYCEDTYTVRTAANTTLKFWEFNLRFKTDSSIHGPHKGEPVLVGQGMQGDRAQVVFASPAEISAFVKSECT